MASCIDCGKPQTAARVLIDRWFVCGDCLYKREYGEPKPSFLEQAVRSIEALALFNADLYRR